ncbi:unnamed protein product [Camellia sinensis]
MKAVVVKIWEVVEEVCLQWRQRQPQHQTITAANGNGNSIDEHDKEEGNGSVPENMEEIGGTEPTEIRSSETYYTTVDSSLSKANGSTREEEEELDVKLKKIDIQKILRSVITHQDEETVKHEISCEEEYMLFKLLSEGTKELVNINRLNHKESDEEIEFEFERVVEKLDQHSVHCPECNSCITKVLCKKVRTSTVPPKPFDLLKCFSCFSIFIPKGIFRRHNGITNEQSLREKSSVLDENLSSIFTDDRKGKMVKIDQQQGRFFDIFRASTSKQNPQPTSAIAGNYSSCVTYETASMVIGQEETKTPSQESVSPGTAVFETAPSTNRVVPPGGLGDLAINIEEGSDDKLCTESEGHQTGDREITDDEKSKGSREQQPIITLDEEGSKTLEILKSVVYGGLMESMTSLSVVSSAAAADATTMNIVAMGLANLIGGFFIFGPNLRELKNEESRYKELLGQTDNFLLHTTVAVLAFLIFGLIPPVTYGFSFRQTDDKDLKLVLVAAASLPCIAILAIGKAYIQKKPNFYAYIKTVLYYIGMAVMASGISYAAGELIKRLVEKLGWFDSSVAVTLSLPQEILKSVVYGGLMESMASLSVVSSAAAADDTTQVWKFLVDSCKSLSSQRSFSILSDGTFVVPWTNPSSKVENNKKLLERMANLKLPQEISLSIKSKKSSLNIVAMGLANLIGGLFIIGPNGTKNEESRYKELLGQTDNFFLHATVVVLVFLIFGLIPLVTYGFSFCQTDDKDLKLVLVVAASLLCIAILAIGKAYIQKKPNFYAYIKTVLYYISMAVMASGISYAAGELIKRLVEKLGWFDSSVAVTLSLPQVQSVNPALGSY